MFTLGQKDLTAWIKKHCFKLTGEYTYFSTCIVALKGGKKNYAGHICIYTKSCHVLC